jgi:TonB family protein
MTAGRSASGHLAEMCFAPRPGRIRRRKYAAIVAILVHFIFFGVIFPRFDYSLPDEERSAVILKKYQPPKLQQRERKVVRKRVAPVPIPDPTPDDPEPIVLDETLFEPPIIPPDAEFVADLPVSSPMPDDFYQAYDMDTDNLIPPRPRRRVQPRYDRDRARRGVQGTVDIQVVITEQGLIGFAEVINGTNDEELDRLALEAVRQWEFSPAVLDERPVPVRAVVTINFRIY